MNTLTVDDLKIGDRLIITAGNGDVWTDTQWTVIALPGDEHDGEILADDDFAVLLEGLNPVNRQPEHEETWDNQTIRMHKVERVLQIMVPKFTSQEEADAWLAELNKIL